MRSEVGKFTLGSIWKADGAAETLGLARKFSNHFPHNDAGLWAIIFAKERNSGQVLSLQVLSQSLNSRPCACPIIAETVGVVAERGISHVGTIMKLLTLLSLLALSTFSSLFAQEAKRETFTPKADLAGDWKFTPDPKLPNVLILGDSISIGYTRDVRKELAGKANVYRPMNAKGPDNCGDTTMGLAGLDRWLGEEKWSVIHCNWGLWDLCYRDPSKAKSGNRDKVNGKISLTVEQYEANLEKIITRLKATGAKLVWANTSNVPEGESGRVAGDEVKYNAAAAKVMTKHKIPLDDLYTLTHGWAGKYSAKAGDVHYTAEGSKLLGSQVAKTILPLLP